MKIKELQKNQSFTSNDPKLSNLHTQFTELLTQLRHRELPLTIVNLINESVAEINSSTLTGTQLVKVIKQKQTNILKQVEKELKVVPQNYYRNLWMAVGFSAFGLPMGALFGLLLKNIGLLGLGLPIGMGIGLVVGASLDKKALNEGRQLNLEIKY